MRRAALVLACIMAAPTQPNSATAQSTRFPLQGFLPFTLTSFWNVKHNSSSIVDTRSDLYIDRLKAAVVGTNYIKLVGTDSDSHGTPFYTVPKSNDPPAATEVVCNDPSGDCFGFNGTSYWLRMPAGANPSDDSDSEMVVFDLNKDANVVVWLYRACPPRFVNAFCTDGGSKDKFTAYSISIHSLSSSGLDGCWPTHYPLQFPAPPLGPNDLNNEGHRGIPGSIIGVRYDEVVAGLIAHTLKIAIPDTKDDRNFFPMVAPENNGGDIPEGIIIRIKPTVDLTDPKWNLNSYEYVIAKALQDYGAIVGDTSDDTANLKVENLIVENSPFKWNSSNADKDVGPDSLKSIPLGSYEFVKRGYGVPAGFVYNGFCESQPPP